MGRAVIRLQGSECTELSKLEERRRSRGTGMVVV